MHMGYTANLQVKRQEVKPKCGRMQIKREVKANEYD